MSAPEVSSHRLAPVHSIPVGEGRAFAVEGRQIAVFRLRAGGGFRALDAVCPHAGGPLADAQIDHMKIVCPLHGYAFSLSDGACLNGDLAVQTYSVREVDGEIVVDVPHAASATDARDGSANRTLIR
jgi:nitrite reductase (NADH) small subunit